MWPIPYVIHVIKRIATSEITALVTFVCVIYLIKIGALWRVVNYFRAALRAVRQSAGPLSLSFGFNDDEPSARLDRASWELRKDTIGVYSIQGRRPHMEDRFNVVDLEQINASIYGVYDGHGGQVCSDLKIHLMLIGKHHTEFKTSCIIIIIIIIMKEKSRIACRQPAFRPHN